MQIRISPKHLQAMLSEMLPFSKAFLKDGKEAGRTAYLNASGAALEMYTGDFKHNFYAERRMKATVIQPGEVGVDITQAIAALDAVKTKPEVTIEIEPKRSGSIKVDRTILPLRGSDDTILRLEVPEDGWIYVTNPKGLVKAASLADKCRRQDDDMQYDINGLCLLPTEGGLELVGTDSNHLIAVKTGVHSDINSIVVCQPTLAKAVSTYDTKIPFFLKIDESVVWVKQEGRVNVLGKLSGDRYPDYRQIVDPNPRHLGILDQSDATDLVKVINRRTLEPTPQKLIRLAGEEDTLLVWGKHVKYSFSVPVAGIKLSPVACSADGLAKMLNLFDSQVEMSISEVEKHLYLRGPDRLAIITLEEDYFK